MQSYLILFVNFTDYKDIDANCKQGYNTTQQYFKLRGITLAFFINKSSLPRTLYIFLSFFYDQKRSSSIYLNHKEEAVDKGNEKKKVEVSVKTCFPNMSPSLPMRKSVMIKSKENIILNTLAFRTLIIYITFSPGYIKILTLAMIC